MKSRKGINNSPRTGEGFVSLQIRCPESQHAKLKKYSTEYNVSMTYLLAHIIHQWDPEKSADFLYLEKKRAKNRREAQIEKTVQKIMKHLPDNMEESVRNAIMNQDQQERNEQGRTSDVK